MALPSQTERTSEMSRPIMTRNGGRSPGPDPKKIAIGAVTLLLVVGAAYGIIHLLPGGTTAPSNAQATPPKVITATPPPRSIAPAPTPTPTPTPITAAPVPEPMAITQGRGGSTTPTPTTSPGGTDPTKPAPVDVTKPNFQPTPGPNASGSPGAQVPSITPSSSTQQVRTLMDAGDRDMASGKLVEARVSFSKALVNADTARADQEVLRAKLSAINDDLLFSSKVTAGDPLAESYTVAAGDKLEKIRAKRDLAIDWRFLARINKLPNANSLRVGQKLKLVHGPFNVIVHKNDFRLDLFAGSPDEPENWLYIRSFRVGLGADDTGTPSGTFVIKQGGKMANPSWTNPKTGQHFDPNDPANPIGEYWLGWEGLGDSKVYTGFGLHGTVDPSSIGQRKSMGCVRMGAEDIAEVYEMLVEQVSIVKVVDDNAMPAATRTGPADMNK